MELSTLLVDYSVQNCNSQNVGTAAMILAAVVARMWERVLDNSTICLFPDNARTYQNGIRCDIAPCICRECGLQEERFLQPETAREIFG